MVREVPTKLTSSECTLKVLDRQLLYILFSWTSGHCTLFSNQLKTFSLMWSAYVIFPWLWFLVDWLCDFCWYRSTFTATFLYLLIYSLGNFLNYLNMYLLKTYSNDLFTMWVKSKAKGSRFLQDSADVFGLFIGMRCLANRKWVFLD